ncbi:MAG: hypothetical protein DME45_00200 [Verrucomicrobia bacterium]|nr:MAG: hypothetical protein DME45_00200 [Verrucomicrobiota bacterium]
MALLFTGAAAANANTYVVNSTGDGDEAAYKAGICSDSAILAYGHCTLRAAIELSNHVGGTNTITFNIPTSDPGYFNGFWMIQPGSQLPDLAGDLSISGPGANVLWIAGGGRNGVRVFNVTTAGTINLSGVNITGGYVSSDFSNQYGAGIQNVNGGTVNITNCTFSYNQSTGDSQYQAGGGAIYNGSTGTVNITTSTFQLNGADDGVQSAAYGGAIWNTVGTIHVTNSTFYHNQSGYFGGAIWNDSGTITVTGSTFYENGAAVGGAIGSKGGAVSVTNSTFYRNIAHRFGDGYDAGVGGAICNFSSSVLNLTNSTVTANFSNYSGGGVFSDNTFGGAVVNVRSTIIAGNFGGSSNPGPAPDVYGPFTSSGFNLIGAKDGSTGFTAATDKKGTAASPLNPKFDPKGLRNNGGPTKTVALVAGSPAIDKGTSVGLTGTLTTDQRGFARTVDNSSIPNASGGDGTDIGAFEFGAQ